MTGMSNLYIFLYILLPYITLGFFIFLTKQSLGLNQGQRDVYGNIISFLDRVNDTILWMCTTLLLWPAILLHDIFRAIRYLCCSNDSNSNSIEEQQVRPSTATTATTDRYIPPSIRALPMGDDIERQIDQAEQLPYLKNNSPVVTTIDGFISPTSGGKLAEKAFPYICKI